MVVLYGYPLYVIHNQKEPMPEIKNKVFHAYYFLSIWILYCSKTYKYIKNNLKMKKYKFLTDRIVKLLKEQGKKTPTEVSKKLNEPIKIVCATMYYLFKQNVLEKYRVRRNVFYTIKTEKD